MYICYSTIAVTQLNLDFLLIRTQVKKTNGDIEISIKVSRPSQECAPLHLGPPQGLKLVIGMFADCVFFIGEERRNHVFLE